jgi:protein tyrosine phosphatase (PTP) superfamily phosphohydrolase (DUF442 family)
MRFLNNIPLLPLLAVSASIYAGEALALTAPNVVPIDATLVTSGQPTRESLAALGSEGYQSVLYLAPSNVHDAVKDEPQILSRQGIEFVHIPIAFGSPTEEDVAAVATALDRLHGKKTLVHCQVNMRASTVVFLYRTVYRHEDPQSAYESVSKVWVPEGPWKQLVVNELAEHRINFHPF